MTNNQLVPTFDGLINNRTQPLCNARDLHSFLEVGRDFANWIKQRIAKYGFVEHKDFLIVQNLSSPNLASSKSRQQTLTDYHLTLNTAKELAMVENNEQGRRVRQYFIQMEEKAVQLQQTALGELNRRVEQLEAMITVRRYGSYHPEAVLNDSEKQQVLKSRKDWKDIHDMALQGMNSIEIGLKLNRDDSGVRTIIRRMRRAGMLPPDPKQVALAIERDLVARHEGLLTVEV